MKYNWNWGILFTEPYFGWLVSGIEWTLIVSTVAWIIAFSVGSLVGVARTVNSLPVRAVATAYVELFRNIPLLVQMFIWFYVVPELVPDGLGRWMKRDMPFPEATSAILCLGTYTASRVAEQVRAGIESIPRGQTAAGLAMGLTLAQVYRYLLVPVGYRIIVPPLTSEFLTIFKNSSLALTIGVGEVLMQARQIENYTFQGFEAFTAATLIYVVVTLVVVFAMDRIEKRARIPGYGVQGRK
ncbi:amino acid ABC transporter permease [Shumkonia mesophila]|uniref:amino acid ABC transporter permease n=1 Tax=Shumkonia mesophila TaxID=2838854 RepID=UPI0029345887|nr:amino acid ABC transporter permease [Shumkonia mesophila]